jgi:hypothetical protein
MPVLNSGIVAVAAGDVHSMSLKALPRLGDLNCDGQVNFGDINPFVLALAAWGAYLETYPNCDIYLVDLNGDGSVDFGVINPFVTLLSGG